MYKDDKMPLSIDWGLKPLQDKLLEMLVYIHSICMSNGIDYSLAYGSALGAVRHNGFVPWDDDVDIYMTADGYSSFKDYFSKHGDKERFYLQELDAIDGMVEMPKLRMNGTTYIEPLYAKRSIHHGIYIDIFILHNAPTNTLARKKMNFANQYLVLKGLSNKHYKNKIIYRPILTLLRLLPYNFLRKAALHYVYKYDGESSNCFYDTDLRIYSKSFYPQNVIFPAIIWRFADVELCIPAKWDIYLTNVYGTYTKLPSVEQIKKTQHTKNWSVDSDFHKYLPNITDYIDESR